MPNTYYWYYRAQYLLLVLPCPVPTTGITVPNTYYWYYRAQYLILVLPDTVPNTGITGHST